MRKIYCFISCILLFVSCREREMQECSYRLKDYRTLPESFIEDISFIQLDPSVPISTVRGCLCLDDYFFVHAKNGLFKFDKDGSFVKQISRKGRSEQEWIGLETFFYSSKNNDLCLVDCPSSKIMHYSLDGEYLYSSIVKTLDIRNVSFAREVGDGILMSGSIYNDNNLIYMYLPYGENKKIVELMTLPFKSDNIVFGIGSTPISIYQDSVKCIVPFDNKLYTLSGNELLVHSIVPSGFPLPDKSFYKKYRNSYHSTEMKVDCMQNNRFWGYDGIFETDSWIVISGGILYTIIEKATGLCWILDSVAISNQFGFPFSDIRCASCNALISVIGQEWLQSILENNPIGEKVSIQIKDSLKGESADNPILVRYKLSHSLTH